MGSLSYGRKFRNRSLISSSEGLASGTGENRWIQLCGVQVQV